MVWFPPKSPRRMMDAAVLNMSPGRARPFKPKRDGAEWRQFYGKDVLISASDQGELYRVHQDVIRKAMEYPAPIWC